VLYFVRNPRPASHGEVIFGLIYIVFALAFSWGTPILLSRRKAQLR